MPTLRESLQASCDKAARWSQSVWSKTPGSRSSSQTPSPSHSRHSSTSASLQRPLSETLERVKGATAPHQMPKQHGALPMPTTPFPSVSAVVGKRDSDSRGSIGRDKQARKRHASDAPTPMDRLRRMSGQLSSPSSSATPSPPSITTRTSSLDGGRPLLLPPAAIALQIKHEPSASLLVQANRLVKQERLVRGDASLEPIETLLTQLGSTRVYATAVELSERGYCASPQAFAPLLRRRYLSVVSDEERSILRAHFFAQPPSETPGIDERLVALFEALELLVLPDNLMRRRFSRALKALPPERFRGRMSLLLRHLTQRQGSDEYWAKYIQFANQLCPANYPIEHFIKFVDYAAEIDAKAFAVLRKAMPELRNALERSIQRKLSRADAQFYVDLFPVVMELPKRWQQQAAVLTRVILDDLRFRSNPFLALIELNLALQAAPDAEAAMVDHWSPKNNAVLLKSIAELEFEQQHRLSRIATTMQVELTALTGEPLPIATQPLYTQLLTTMARLEEKQLVRCQGEIDRYLDGVYLGDSLTETLQALCLIATRHLRAALAPQRPPRPRAMIRCNTLPTVAED